MPKFLINYTKKSWYSCVIEAQNECQIEELFRLNLLDLNNERFGDSNLDALGSIEKIKGI